MLTKEQEKIIFSLRTKKGRLATGKCLVEGRKNIEAAGKTVEYIFTEKDTKRFAQLITTDTPQTEAAVATIPQFTVQEIERKKIIVVLDTVQDPGNVGAIIRLCLAFNAGLLLVASADSMSPKVIRASAGAAFNVPHIEMTQKQCIDYLHAIERPVFRLEKKQRALHELPSTPSCIIAGSEGHGITLPVSGTSITIKHDPKLESLNVGHALAIALYQSSQK